MPANDENSLGENSSKTIEQIRSVLRDEAAAIEHVAQRLDHRVDTAVDLLHKCTGRIIVTGMGKMGCIARKAAATFSSTGAPANFLHAAEAAHGDFGIITEHDVVVALSYSGQTAEILGVLSFVQRQNVSIIGLTGNTNSELARHATVALDIAVPDEADPISMAPTNSSTATLALCDALAIALMQRRGFTREQFAIFHPGGSLGRKLLVKTAEVMTSGDEIPTVIASESIKQAIVKISQKRLGAVIVVNDSSEVLGILTDGDLRRVFEHQENPLADPVAEHMTAPPVTAKAESLAAEALRIMEEKQITVLPVVDQQNKLAGIVHLHDLIRGGLA